MSEAQEPRNGIYYNWDPSDEGYGTGINLNLLYLGLRLYLSVINMTTSTPPVSPTLGDTYIVAATATGDWAGLEGYIAVWSPGVETGTPSNEWQMLDPNAGWLCFDESTGQLHAHNGSGWSTNGFAFTF
jgi:hypothetical protein